VLRMVTIGVYAFHGESFLQRLHRRRPLPARRAGKKRGEIKRKKGFGGDIMEKKNNIIK
jgi:hypothetical protein